MVDMVQILMKLFCVLFYFRLVAAAVINANQRIIESGRDFELTCESDVPVHWCYPEIYNTPDLSEGIKYESPTKISFSKEASKYKTIIHVQNASYIYTGFYHCLRNDTQALCNRHIDSSEISIYMFVKDAENLMLLSGFTKVLINKDDNALLPCLPTNPNVHMTLMIEGEEMELGKDPHSNITVTFDNTSGFILTSMNSRKSNDYICKATLGLKTEELLCSVSYYPIGGSRPTTNTHIPVPKDDGSRLAFPHFLIILVLIDLLAFFT